ncbi:MAG: hypothetical protein ACLQIQ_06945 [Beijerinckiaceae bacterium]
MAADEKSGKGTVKQVAKRGAGARKKAADQPSSPAGPKARKTAAKPLEKTAAATKSAAKSASAKKASSKSTPAKTSVAKSSARKAASRAAAPIFKTSAKGLPVPPLPPASAQPKRASRSLARRAVGAATVMHRNGAVAGESFAESELREMMRLASAYIETWLNRRILLATDATAPEDAWAQVWLWLKGAAALEDGRVLTQDLFEALYADEMTSAR